MFTHRPLLVTLLGFLAIATTACSTDSTAGPAAVAPAAPTAQASPVAAQPSPTAKAAQPDPYRRALERASSAAVMGQSAQSQDDWRLAARRWQQAIDFMASVPPNSTNRAQAQTKIRQYRRNLAIAQSQANRIAAAVPSEETITLPPQLAEAPAPAIPVATPAAVPEVATNSSVVRIPIVRRSGGTPVIRVMFNGSQPYDMILDTGASGTLITQQMAANLGVRQIGEARLDTASEQNVRVPLGYVRSVEVGGLRVSNLVVAVAGPDLSLGLLGHDFFGNYDVTIRQNEVEFYLR